MREMPTCRSARGGPTAFFLAVSDGSTYLYMTMDFIFDKYHALKNDFILIDGARRRLPKTRIGRLASAICDRKSGVGADGLLYLTASERADRKIDVFNCDGTWAEKSGNGLRIAAAWSHDNNKKKKRFLFDMGDDLCQATVLNKQGRRYSIKTELGVPSFEAARVPVVSKTRYVIQNPLKLGGRNFPVTCLAVGNPHTVLFVDDFDFDWQALGEEIENHRNFPNRTNVEFVKIVNRRSIQVADWERGAGATGSSGTGAAAAVCAAVMIGRVERQCDIQFSNGIMHVKWNEATNSIELTGPAERICRGTFEF